MNAASGTNAPSGTTAPPGCPALAGALAGMQDLPGMLRAIARHQAETERAKLALVGRAIREGVFEGHGVRPIQGVADLLGLDRPDAVRLARAAEQLCERTSLHGEVLAPKMPVLASALNAGATPTHSSSSPSSP